MRDRRLTGIQEGVDQAASIPRLAGGADHPVVGVQRGGACSVQPSPSLEQPDGTLA